MRSSQKAFDDIVAYEVSSEGTYRQKYRRPEWPGAQSGATIGIGYDLGQTAKTTITADWKGRVPDDMLDAMLSASGKTGAAGRTATAEVRSKIDIPWDVAIAVHREKVLPRWEATLEKALPNTDKLSPDSFGALVSLIFNRGTSFNKSGDRYKEMRAIKRHMAAENFAAIPGEIREMKRLWNKATLPGLHDRRDREASLFERGLAVPSIPSGERPKTPQTDELQRRLAAEAALNPARRPSPEIMAHPQFDLDTWYVQFDLKTMNYNPGGLDGRWGGNTSGAIAGFVNDRAPKFAAPTSDEMFRAILPKLQAAIVEAEAESFKRPVAIERAEASEATIAKSATEIVPVKQSKLAGYAVAVTTTIGAIFKGVTEYFTDALSWVSTLTDKLPIVPWYGWAGLVVIVSGGLGFLASRGQASIVDAFRKGKRT